MERKLQHYTVTLTTEGPLFIGSGRKVGKKEYILNRNRAYIPDMTKMMAFLTQRRLADAYEDFLLGREAAGGSGCGYENMSRGSAKNNVNRNSGRRADDFAAWLYSQKIGEKEYRAWTAYVMDCGDVKFDAEFNKSKNRNKELYTFQKDAYGQPYVPGSSLKGMLRTALLAREIKKNPRRFEAARNEVYSFRNWYKKRECRRLSDSLEKTAFRLLELNKNQGDAINDWLRGLRVGDSEPLGTDALTLCQKIDIKADGTENRLPILRECIKPGTKIRFPLTIDSRYCPYTPDEIYDALMEFLECYDKNFRNKFGFIDRAGKNKFPYDARDIYLGGGAGYVSKTVLYVLLSGREGLRKASEILNANFRQHGHDRDEARGVSPHVLKCTRWNGRLYELGVCTIAIE